MSRKTKTLAISLLLSSAVVSTLQLPALAQAEISENTGTIERIIVNGNQRIEDRTVLSYILVEPGSSFDANRIDLSLKSLFATGLFADAKFDRVGNQLVITLVENPIVSRVMIEGNKAMAEDKIREEIQIAPRGVFTAARMQADVQRIMELYRQSGRFAAKVTPEYVPLDQNRVDVIFSITEGPVSGVRAINFLGNEEYSDNRLRKEIVTRQSRWWQFFSSNDNYDPGRMEYDRDLLRQFYQNKGYYDFRVESAVAELTPDQKDFYITYTIDEGEIYRFGEVSVETELEKLNTDALRASLSAKSGDLFRGDTIEQSIDGLTYVAGIGGYAFIDVRPEISADMETKTVNVTFHVNEGPRVYINRINIVGNTQTLDRVIRRELRINEGDAFNRVLLDRSRNRVRALGYFKDVEVTELPTADPDQIDVDLKVTEQPTGEMSFSAGFSSSESFLVDVSVAQRNVLGRGQSASARVSTSALQQILDLQYTEPRFLDRNMSAGLGAFATRLDYSDTDLGGYTTESMGVSAQLGFPLSDRLQLGLKYTLQNDKIDVVDQSIVIDEDSGERLTSEYTVDDGGTPGDTSDDITGVTYVSADDVPLPDGSLIVDVCDIRYLNRYSLCSSERSEISSIVGYNLLLDMKNDPLEPTGGFDLLFGQDVSGFGGDVNFIRTNASMNLYQGITKSVVASLRLSGGYIEPYGTSEGNSEYGQTTPQGVRINNRFFKGGNNFRGFDTAGLGPRIVQIIQNDDGTETVKRLNALGGNAFYQASLDLSIPNYLPEEYGIKTGLFLEAGSVGLLSDVDKSDPVEFTDTYGRDAVQLIEDELSLRASTGLSVYWTSPFGPIRFDFSHVLKSEEYDRTESFRFSTSTRF
ncbi:MULTISPECIES: outer membrane protein assembly factor BamA [Hyphomonas]|jgi:outer membrane protein insertion porin family|uniref:outer membrane protein assembly factor BamA n=1 Tax=Hyphomonas TaxID=85 RepID=UPI0035173407